LEGHALTLTLLLMLSMSTSVSAETLVPQWASEPTVVRVGIKLEQIVNIDQKAESFTAVYTLQLRYRDPGLAFERAPNDPPFRMMTLAGFLAKKQEAGLIWPDIVLANKQGRRDVNLESVEIHPDGEVRLYERATATFQAPDFDFRDFPFDTQNFYIRLESLMPTSVFLLEPLRGYSGIGDQLGEEEWVVFESFSDVDTIIGPDDRRHSRFSLGFQAHRHVLYYVVRIFIPMLIILVVSWITFRLKDYVKRIDLGITVLLLFIAFNFTLGSDLPRLGYLTAVDAFISGTFVITGAVILVNVQLRLLERQGREAEAARLDRIAMIGYWPAYLLGMSTALLLL
jgi:hypothetical protein